jgi:hypothetical protein
MYVIGRELMRIRPMCRRADRVVADDARTDWRAPTKEAVNGNVAFLQAYY